MKKFIVEWIIILLLVLSFFQVNATNYVNVIVTENEKILKPKLENKTYLPDSIMSWHIIPSPEQESSVIEMTIKYLDVDDYSGDYVLIGVPSTSYGNVSDVFGGPPPLFLTGRHQKSKKILVAADGAYVVLHSKKSSKRASGFEIFYQRIGVSIPSVKTESPLIELWKKAIPVCVTTSLNISLKQVESNVPSIVSKLADRYMRIKNLYQIQKISDYQIQIFVHSKRKDGSFYFLLTITSPDDGTKASFSSLQLKEMLYNQQLYEYQIWNCETESTDQLRMYIMYGVVSFLVVFFLFVWWWRYNSYWNSRFKERESIETPLKLNISMYPAQVDNPVYQPDSPVSLTESEEKPDFMSQNINSAIKKYSLSPTDSSSSWSPQVSSWNNRNKRKKFVSFAAVEFEKKEDEDVDGNKDSAPTDTITETSLQTYAVTKL